MKALKAKNINLAERLAEAKSKRQGQGRGKVRLMLPVIILLLIIGGVMSWFWFKLLPEQAEACQQAVAYLNDEAHTETYNNALLLTAERDALQLACNSLEEALDNINSYQELNRELYGVLSGAAGATPVMLTNIFYNRDSGALSLTGLTADAQHSADFAEKLRTSGTFTDIAYYGYELGDGSYSFMLDCLVPSPQNAAVEGGAA